LLSHSHTRIWREQESKFETQDFDPGRTVKIQGRQHKWEANNAGEPALNFGVKEEQRVAKNIILYLPS
jgi:hypothetical protein